MKEKNKSFIGWIGIIIIIIISIVVFCLILRNRQNTGTAENWILKEKLGAGTFGTVFKAQHRDKQNYAAVKVIKLSGEAIPVMREPNVLKKCQHQNIVEIYEAWIEKADNNAKNYTIPTSSILNTAGSLNLMNYFDLGIASISKQNNATLYIAMELCQNDLSHWLQVTKLETRASSCYDIFCQIVEGVCYIHMKGFIHRDLKPNNIFFGQDGKIKIGDFGLVTKSTQREHRVVGTKFYSPPEMESKNYFIYDKEIDIYALGIILCELILYFKTDSQKRKTIENIKNGNYPDKLYDHYQNEVKLIQGMLSNPKENRPTSLQLKTYLLQNPILPVIQVPFHQSGLFAFTRFGM